MTECKNCEAWSKLKIGAPDIHAHRHTWFLLETICLFFLFYCHIVETDNISHLYRWCVAGILTCSLLPLFEGGGLGGGVGVCDRTKRKTHQGGRRRATPDLLLCGGGSVAVLLFLPFRRKTPSPTSLVSRSPMTSAPATGRWSATGSSGCWEKPSIASVPSALRWWPLTR